jgi:hypothetical protein
MSRLIVFGLLFAGLLCSVWGCGNKDPEPTKIERSHLDRFKKDKGPVVDKPRK